MAWLPCRGKCTRGASCRYSHVDPHMLAGNVPPSSAVHPALVAAGMGGQSNTFMNTNTMQGNHPCALSLLPNPCCCGSSQRPHDTCLSCAGTIAGMNHGHIVAQSRHNADFQTQAALLLSGLNGSGILGAGLPSTPVAGANIPAAWNSIAALQQSPEGLVDACCKAHSCSVRVPPLAQLHLGIPRVTTFLISSG